MLANQILFMEVQLAKKHETFMLEVGLGQEVGSAETKAMLSYS